MKLVKTDHDDVRDHLVQYVNRDPTLSVDVCHRIEAHLGVCAACRREWEELFDLRADVLFAEEAGQLTKPPLAPVAASILAESPGGRASQPRRSRVAAWFTEPVPRVPRWVAIAAMLVVVVIPGALRRASLDGDSSSGTFDPRLTRGVVGVPAAPVLVVPLEYAARAREPRDAQRWQEVRGVLAWALREHPSWEVVVTLGRVSGDAPGDASARIARLQQTLAGELGRPVLVEAEAEEREAGTGVVTLELRARATTDED